jgi:hypothetical protein
MELIEVAPPFARDELEELARAAYVDTRLDITATVDWIMARPAERIAEDIRIAWQLTDLPLRELANKLCAVRLVRNSRRNHLELACELSDGATLYQQAPIATVHVEQASANFAAYIPVELRQLAGSAPGMRWRGVGRVADWVYFTKPLSHLNHWLKMQRESGQDLRRAAPHLQELAIEVAGDGLWNLFVMSRDGGLYFFDHLEQDSLPLKRCKPDVPSFIQAYFRNPECVFDDEFLF